MVLEWGADLGPEKEARRAVLKVQSLEHTMELGSEFEKGDMWANLLGSMWVHW